MDSIDSVQYHQFLNNLVGIFRNKAASLIYLWPFVCILYTLDFALNTLAQKKKTCVVQKLRNL